MWSLDPGSKVTGAVLGAGVLEVCCGGRIASTRGFEGHIDNL